MCLVNACNCPAGFRSGDSVQQQQQQQQQPPAVASVSHLASKHPAAFYQLLDLGARSDHGQQLHQFTSRVSHLLQLLADGSSEIGTPQLAMLLQQPTAVTALGSVLCSATKALKSCLDAALACCVDAAAGMHQQHQQQQDLQHTYAVVQGGKATVFQGLNTRLYPAGHSQGGILRQLSRSLPLALQQALLPPAAAEASSSSSGSDTAGRDSTRSQQAAASATFLLVLLSRGLLALHETVLGMSAADAAALGFDKAVTAADFSVSSDAVFTDIACKSDGDLVLFVLESLEVFRGVYGMLKLCLQTQLEDVTSKQAAKPACTETGSTALDSSWSSSSSSSSSSGSNKSTGADSRPSSSNTAAYNAESILLAEWFTAACWQRLLQRHKRQQLLQQRISKCHVPVAVAAAAAAAAEAAVAAAAAAAAAGASGSSSSCSSRVSSGSSRVSRVSSGSSSSSQGIRWQYLLRLQESRKLATAMAKFDSSWCLDHLPTVQQVSNSIVIWHKLLLTEVQSGEADHSKHPSGSNSSSSFEFDHQISMEKVPGCTFRHAAVMRRLDKDAMEICRILVAVTPLPVVCNNPGCRQLQGASEAAAAKFVCAGCGCRYCSAACQVAGWRSHKKACRRMATCGMRVEQQLGT
jgi:hypothetical protein